MQESGRPLAERRVREALLLEALAAKHAIEVSELDLEARLGEMAQAQGMDVGALRQMATTQGWLPALEVELRNRKVFELLESNALIDESPMEARDEEA
jgi:FKBP-type peptidyl-prolyl cis-trans isomerase (trigger factor)